MMGRAKKITITKDDTIILDGSGDKTAIGERCDQIREAIAQSQSDYDRSDNHHCLDRKLMLFGSSRLYQCKDWFRSCTVYPFRNSFKTGAFYITVYRCFCA